jgi:hypothetical protein
MGTWTIKPGIAALVNVISPNNEMTSAIFLSEEEGVVLGIAAKPLAKSDLPVEIKAALNRHFATVFFLEHETWKGIGPSPRAQYVDALVPWTIEVPDETT